MFARITICRIPVWLYMGSMLLLAGRSAAAMSPEQVHLEIAFEQRGGLDAPHRWLADLKSLRFASLKLRAAQRNEAARMDMSGDPANRLAFVTAVLAGGDTLVLPGARVRRGELAALRSWIDRLDRGDVTTGASSATEFGLSEPQLRRLQARLGVPITSDTVDLPLREFLSQCQTKSGIEFAYSPAAKRQLSATAQVADSLRGIAIGTAAAIALRTANLGMVPQPQPDGTIRIEVVVRTDGSETWPVGHKLQQPLTKAAPELFESIPVEITGASVEKALGAVTARLSSPVILDRAGMAAQGIDLSKVKVDVPAGRTRYKPLLDRILSKAKLKLDAREDDAGRMFLWIRPRGIER
ncbi:MAG: hypothetical protein KDA92_00525 [Planctomycetales bacterium]|nr:hypothetical protein [Planctomycetales bacterium]